MDEPVIYRLPRDENIFNSPADVYYASTMTYPQFSLGFHHYQHQSKNKTHIFDSFKGKKVYLVLNPYEHQIDDYDQDINHAAQGYFELANKPPILSRAFYKMWEMFYLFPELVPNTPGFVSAHLAEGPGSFIQATILYRELLSKNAKQDKYYAVTLHSDTAAVPAIETEFLAYYKQLHLHKTTSKGDNGDLTKFTTYTNFSKQFENTKATLVTADGGFVWENENTQEQEAYYLIFGEIITAVNIQAKGGSFVCKIFESFTNVTIKFMQILAAFYTDVYVVKPLMSRKSNSEKYLVCTGYKFAANDKIRTGYIKKLEDILQTFENNTQYMNDLFSEFSVSEAVNGMIIEMNTDISNKQYIAINEMVDFINQQNYRGSVYTDSRERQIIAAKQWIDTFFSDKTAVELRDKVLKKNDKDAAQLIEKLRL